jgi:uncharacterized protein YdbL (DUF1318 family)
MMKAILVLILGVVFILGCARVRVEAPKEPIKVDITMRLDVYQHVQKDIDAIEGIVSGSEKPTQPSDKQSLLNYLIFNAYAQEDLAPDVKEAALRRKDRVSELVSWQEKGVIGENKSGLLEIRNSNASGVSLEQLVKAENEDRMIIYKALAAKNNTTIEEIQKIYAGRLQEKASQGTPIEVLNQSTGAYEWKVK